MTDPQTPSAAPHAPPAAPKPPSKIKAMAIKAGIALGLALLVFLVGLFVGRSPVGDLRERAESVESRLALAQDNQHMTDASVLLYRTALDLEARNFGTANERLREAGAALARVGVVGSELEGLVAAIDSTDLTVAADLATQRQTVLGFAGTLQNLLPIGEAAVSEGSAGSDSTETG